jgi:hypothetical protein
MTAGKRRGCSLPLVTICVSVVTEKHQPSSNSGNSRACAEGRGDDTKKGRYTLNAISNLSTSSIGDFTSCGLKFWVQFIESHSFERIDAVMKLTCSLPNPLLRSTTTAVSIPGSRDFAVEWEEFFHRQGSSGCKPVRRFIHQVPLGAECTWSHGHRSLPALGM